MALELPGRVTWSPDLVAVSIALGIMFAGAALAVAVRREDARGTLIAGLLLTLAIVSHHFTAMGAAEVIPDPTRAADQFSMSPAMLAIAIANAALAILGLSFAGALADRRLKEKGQQMATAVNNMSQGLLMFDATERLVMCNDRYLEMYGLSPEEAKPGLSLRDIIRNRIATGTLARDPDEYRTELLDGIRTARSRNGSSRALTDAPSPSPTSRCPAVPVATPRRHHRTAARRTAHRTPGAS